MRKVSIAGAILWGVLQGCAGAKPVYLQSFNRRGDSLGGAAWGQDSYLVCPAVSIAGAILWGVLPELCSLHTPFFKSFNRRGDSLGGAAVCHFYKENERNGFNRRGDSLGGAAFTLHFYPPLKSRFQSQGRFFGGCCTSAVIVLRHLCTVSIAGAILWGVLL